MSDRVGLGAVASLSAIQALNESIQSNWNTYAQTFAQDGCGSTVASNLASAVGSAQSIVSMLQSFPLVHGFPDPSGIASTQLVPALNALIGLQPTSSTGFHCVNAPYANAVQAVVQAANVGVTTAQQWVAQVTSGNSQSLSITSGHSGILTVAVLGWPYSVRPIVAQVQGMLSGSWPQASSQFLQPAVLAFSNVSDTGKSDVFGNPIFTVNVSASGGGTVTAYPATKSPNSAGYNAVLCGSSWCLGVVSYTDTTTPSPISLAPFHFPTATPAPTFVGPPFHTGAPITLQPGTSPPTGVTAPPTLAAGTSSTGKDVLIGVAVTAGLAAIGAGVLWFAHRQHEHQTAGIAKRRT
jgi:hypothetical protein